MQPGSLKAAWHASKQLCAPQSERHLLPAATHLAPAILHSASLATPAVCHRHWRLTGTPARRLRQRRVMLRLHTRQPRRRGLQRGRGKTGQPSKGRQLRLPQQGCLERCMSTKMHSKSLARATHAHSLAIKPSSWLPCRSHRPRGVLLPLDCAPLPGRCHSRGARLLRRLLGIHQGLPQRVLPALLLQVVQRAVQLAHHLLPARTGVVEGDGLAASLAARAARSAATACTPDPPGTAS